jgi:hypothetical protein
MIGWDERSWDDTEESGPSSLLLLLVVRLYWVWQRWPMYVLLALYFIARMLKRPDDSADQAVDI